MNRGSFPRAFTPLSPSILRAFTPHLHIVRQVEDLQVVRAARPVDKSTGTKPGNSLHAGSECGNPTGDTFATLTEARWRSRSVRFPSLPAGINTDDSDPLGPDRGTVLSAAIGAGRNPRFGGGVAIVSPDFSVSARWKPISVGTNHRKQKTSRNVGLVHPHAFFRYTPPLSLYRKACGSKYHEKLTKNAPSNRLRKTGSAVRRIIVNRDPFRPGSRSAPAPVLSEEHGFLALVFVLCIIAGLVGVFLVLLAVRFAGGVD